ncbi:uncharacterized protein MJAP1_001675 [Malassezia japonica]|uniref:Uncharacterized protein n=1 Tax=Malassezia japonica TaxID=223818 RepID=A0AAF0J9F9_9BASI|nr:uncharacterized protein MJAP1_001675 [Malassezia japonica]WFD38712.1 hypothetical protein MJAP1_001675 [Malassezia japonica]
MGLRWDPREDPAVLWTWLVAVITALEFLMETTLLNRQLKLSRAKGVPTVLRDIAPEAFITSAERFRITHATRFIYAAFRTAFVFFFVLDGGLSALWNRAGAFFVAYFNLMLLYQKGMVEKPKPFVNYIFDIKTMLAIGWLTLLAYSSESLQNDLSIEDSTGAGDFARTLEANEEEDQPVTDWIDYDSGDAAAISGAQKRHFVQALVKLYLVCNVPLFSDPLYNAYYQKRPALADRLAVLGPVDMELGLDDKVDTPYLDESDSDIAVPSIMLLP